MMTSNTSDIPVWAKGDSCLSPYSGDSGLYRGVIRKLRHSPQGDVLALVRFSGYDDEDSEEVNVSQLQKVKPKEKTKTIKHNPSYESDGLFKPLQGRELENHLKAKYEVAEEEEDEEEERNERRERLSQVLFEKKTKPQASQSPAGGSRKGIVVTGGEAISASSKAKSGSSRHVSDEANDEAGRSPSAKKKPRLDISGGAAVNPQSELKTSKPLSDINSIVDPRAVKQALRDEQEAKSNINFFEAEPGERAGSDDRNGVGPDRGEVTGCDSGFDDEDMEKPRFSFTSCGAKVPFLLSEPDEDPVIQVPATINQYLRDYQREGIQFLYNHYKNNQGAILGDDMGLGKTVQVIGFLSALFGKKGNRVDVMRQKPRFIRKLSDSACISADTDTPDPFLIIGPGCVLYNWLEEFETWGYFTVRKFHGGDKKECLKEVRKGKVEVVVTTFETFRDHQEVLNEISWSAVIADEVHKIKGLKAQTTKALRNITTTKRFGLTGTALQNNLLEFWSLLDWAQPGCLGRQADFEAEFVQAIELGQRHDANKRELALARKKKEKFARVRQEMMIRRTKKIISEQLPKKDDNVVFCKLSQLQVSMYQTILNHKDMGLVLHMGDPCPCDSGKQQSKCCFKKTTEGFLVRGMVFTFMHLLLKVSNHVALIVPKEKASEKQVKHAEQICKAAFAEHPDFMTQTRDASFRTLSDPKYCGKMKILQGLLKVFYKEHGKVLLFSYSTQVLDILEQYMMSTGYEYRRIDGSVSPKKRMIIVREFNTDPNLFICLVSTKAGGLGLNLTGANKVIIFDPNWNPTHDLQAQDRAYRIGQRRNVQVYRLVSAGTIEENMYLRQIYKQQLLNVTVEDENARRYFYAVQGNPRQKGELFGIKNMFHLRTGESCLTVDILKNLLNSSLAKNQGNRRQTAELFGIKNMFHLLTGESCLTMDILKRVETGLAGCEMARYVPPVVRVEEDEDDDEEWGEAGQDHPTPGLESDGEEEEMFEQFFATQAADATNEAIEDADSDKNDIDEDANDSVKTAIRKTPSSAKTPTRKTPPSTKTLNRKTQQATDADMSDSNQEDVPTANANSSSKKTRTRVRFLEDDEDSTQPGKVRPSQSRTGKGPVMGPVRSRNAEEPWQVYDQTLAGTFNDVSDVFDQCGIVHIHENVKVVGGSRAEDHMTRCAINDVYELHQNSQDLAVQCQPMEESSEEETEKEREKKKKALSELNKPRSVMVGGTKVLIGQTPKFYRQKQFEEMRQFHGASSLLEFAQLVLGVSLEERVALLNKFYGESSGEELGDILKLDTRGRDKERQERKVSAKIRKAKPDSVTNKKRRKYLNVRHGAGVSFVDDGPHNESLDPASLEPGGREEPDVPLSQASLALTTQGTCDSIDGSYRFTTKTRKQRSQQGTKQKQSKDGRKKQNKRSESVDLSLDIEDDSDGYRGRYDARLNYADNEANVDDLLCEMSKYSEEKDSIERTKHSQESSSRTFNKQEKKNQVKKSPDKAKRTEAASNILDDLFSDTDSGVVKRKPPPAKTKNEDTTRKSEKASKHSKYSDNSSKAFQEVDEIFSTSADSASDSAEVQLDTSTLKDDNIDCFSDPAKWKKRKKGVRDRRTVADRLIADSEEEFNDLFRSGKLRRKQPRHTRQETPRKESVDEVDEVDGSLSLFS